MKTALTGNALTENPDYLSSQLVTYIGSKRALLGFLDSGISIIMKRLGKKKLKTFDVFSGSGIVSRYLKQYSESISVNDIEDYSRVINSCYLANRSELDEPYLREIHDYLLLGLEENKLRPGFIRELYSPADDKDIKKGERVFYTIRNACYLDTARMLLDEIDPGLRDYFLAPLLSEASVHTNTAGVFKGFYKNTGTGIGKFGGRNGDALLRILGDIYLGYPVFSNFECEVNIFQGDSNDIVQETGDFDVAYLDPPYNQHPYGSNYFMLNLLVNYKRPSEISPVSGIPPDWRRSRYNVRKKAYDSFRSLVYGLRARFLLISFNSEGFIGRSQMIDLLEEIGKVEVLETRYNTFRGSRNLQGRKKHVTEYLYLVEKKVL